MPSDEAVEGLQDLLKSMDGIQLTRRKTIIAQSLRKAGQPILNRGKELAPDDPETPQSRIEESMAISVNDQTAEGAVARIGPTKRGFPGIFPEIGTAHQPQKPWLGPAFDDAVDEAYDILAEELGAAIEREFRR